MTDPATAPPGAWPTPITARDAARGDALPAAPLVMGTEIWWQESRPDSAGRVTVLRCALDGSPVELLTEGWSARTRVHEYGGRSYLPVPTPTGHGIVFSELSDQRLYRLDRDSTAPYPLTPHPQLPAGDRYAETTLSADQHHLICVRERHTPAVSSAPAPESGSEPEAGEETEEIETGPEAETEDSEPAETSPSPTTVHRTLVSIPLDGSAAKEPTAVVELLDDAQFYASPVVSPDGQHLAWISWNHPRMPWDGTELRVARITAAGQLSEVRTLKGSPTESVVAPRWRDATTLYCVSDWSGWWNLYEVGLHGPPLALYPAQEEFSPAPLALGIQPYCVLSDGRILALHGDSELRPASIEPTTAEITELDTELTWYAIACSADDLVVGVAGSATSAPAPVRLDPDSATVTPLRTPAVDGSAAIQHHLPTPRREIFTGRYGEDVHANVYPPTHPDHAAASPAPYVVWVHGGPTACAPTTMRLELAYFTSRGIGVVDVNYGGSTGFGRSYRERLRNEWGVVDVEDVVAVAQGLVTAGEADPDRLAVRGGSAGGLTTLLALTRDTFACGVSLYGVTDLLRLAEQTHDFESRYLDSLVGPLPGYQATYVERSPVNRATEIDVPVLLVQGTEDPIVPVEQATTMAEQLAERKVAHTLLTIDKEGHGFRETSSRVQALETELAFYASVFGFTPPDVSPLELRSEPAS